MASVSFEIFVFTVVSRTSQAENVSLELKIWREAQHLPPRPTFALMGTVDALHIRQLS